jgi:hypothetical protein
MTNPDAAIVIAGEVMRADADAAWAWHAAAMQRRARPSRIEFAVFLAVAMALLLLGVPFAIILLVGPDAALAGLMAAVFGFWVALLFVKAMNGRTWQRIRELRRMGVGFHSYSFAPDGIGVEAPSGVVSRTPWTAIERIDITPRHLAFWHDGYFAQTIPRSLIGSPRAEANLLSAISRWATHITVPVPRA